MAQPDSLKQQLENARFERAFEATESLAYGRALLTTSELGRFNQMVSGKIGEIWRNQATTVTLPTGKQESLTLIKDPILTAREKLHRSFELAEKGFAIDAALDLYIGLILSHVFLDANRRTAALASHYFFIRYDIPASGMVLHSFGLGDLRQEEHTQNLRQAVYEMVKFEEKRRKR